MGWYYCTTVRLKSCAQKADEGYSQCTEQADEGYSSCTQTRDDGYRNCCDWWPCSWACDAWTWISNVVCVFWTWISNLVCVLWTWISNVVCVAWTVVTIPFCLILPDSITHWMDKFVGAVLDGVGGLIGGAVWAASHPIDAAGAIIGLFGGCPDVHADEHPPLLIIAHHGYPVRLPENTIQSGAYALNDRKADSLEIDLCMTSDGEIVVWHDWDPDDPISLARQEGLQAKMAWKPHVPLVGDSHRRPVIDLTLQEFRDFYSYQFQGDPVDLVKLKIDLGDIDLTIPTLEEYVSEAVRWTGLRLLCLDVKMPPDAVDRARDMIDKIHASVVRERGFDVVVMVPHDRVLAAMKQRADEQQYDLKFTWDIEFPAGIIVNPHKYSAVEHAVTQFHNRAASVGEPAFALFPWRTYRETIAYDIKRWNAVNADPAKWNAGQKIEYLIAWTIDDEDEMRCLVDMGVSGIITDYTDVLAKVVGR